MPTESIAPFSARVEEEDAALRRMIEGRKNPGGAQGGAGRGEGLAAAGEGARELSSEWLRDAEEEVKDVSLARGAAGTQAKRLFSFTVRTSGGTVPAGKAHASSSAAATAATSTTVESTGELETEASPTQKLALIHQRLLELASSLESAEAMEASLTCSVGGASTDALDLYVDQAASKDATQFVSRLRAERQGLEEEQKRLSDFLALVRPAFGQCAAENEEASGVGKATSSTAEEVGSAFAAAKSGAASAAAEACPPPEDAGCTPAAPLSNTSASSAGLAALLAGGPSSKRARLNHPQNTHQGEPHQQQQYDGEPEDLTRYT